MTVFEELVLLYPTCAWDWAAVSRNPSISFKFILDHPELTWNPKYVSMNTNITEQDIRDNVDYLWDLEGLSSNPNMNISFYEEFIIKPLSVHRVNWNLLSANKSITIFDIINTPKYKWNYRYLSANINLTSNYILNEGRVKDWFVPYICSNVGITERDIFKSTMKDLFAWDYKNLSSNTNLPIVYVNDNINCDWNYYAISSHASMHDINKFHQIPWDDNGLSINKNITLDYVVANSNRKWDYKSLLANEAVNYKSVLENFELFTQHLTIETINQYLSSNPSISLGWIKNNFMFIDWKRLSNNRLLVK